MNAKTLITTFALTLISTAAAAQPCQTSALTPQLCKGSRTWGNGDFSGGYDLEAGAFSYADAVRIAAMMQAQGFPYPLPPNDYIWVGGKFAVDTKLFGESAEVATVENAVEHSGGTFTPKMRVRIAGLTVVNLQATLPGITIPFARSALSVDESLDLGLASINVEAEATVIGQIAQGYSNGAYQLTPSARSLVAVSASADVLCGGAGASGSLTALDFSLPMSVAIQNNQFTLDADYAVKSINGKLKAYVDICVDRTEITFANFTAVNIPRSNLFNVVGQ